MIKKNLILISFFFPPLNHIASRRIYAFAKYLSESYNVTVITYTKEKDYSKEFSDFKVIYLNNGVFANFTTLNGNEHRFTRLSKVIIRKTLSSLNIGFHPLWKKKAIHQLHSILNNNNISYIISSYMPIEAHEVCYEVLNSSSKYNNIYWVGDMRDEMSEHTILNERQKKYYKSLEKKYAKRMNLVTSVSEPILNQFRRNMSSKQDFLEVRNGYDHNIKSTHRYTDKLRIGYFGNFYADRKPTNFFSALSKFKHIEDIEVIIASKFHNYTIPKKISSNIKQINFLPYEDSIKKMGEMDCNLLILPFKNENEGVYSGKLFDYLSTGRPILGLINESDVAAKLIKAYECDYLANPNDINEILNALTIIHKDWQKNKLKSADINEVQQLHRKKQVEKLSSHLKNNT